MCNSFIWDAKRPKLSIQTLQHQKSEGGLNLVDLRLKDNSLKINWIKWIQEDNLLQELAFRKLSTTLRNDIWYCNLKTEDIVQLFVDSFWRDVLIAWSKVNYQKQVCDNNEIKKQIIWFNSHNTIEGKPFLFPKAYRDELKLVCQLFSYDGKLLSAEVLSTMYDITIMQCNQILSAIPNEWRVSIKENSSFVNENNYLYDDYLATKKLASKYYKELNARCSKISNLALRWSTSLKMPEDEELMKSVMNRIYSVTNFPKYRSLQYRIVTGSLVLNKKLKVWKVRNDDLCTMCGEETEDIIHFYIECSKAQQIWLELECYIKLKYSMTDTLDWSAYAIIFNAVIEKPMHVVNLLVMIVKSCLYTNRCLGNKTHFNEIKAKMETIKRYELYNAKKNNTVFKTQA